ncbi:MAG: hypothetical protein NTY38_04230, partial [Acidobacteria bacterium]|nr:hypothetical protein [Acidobacteriota bacterium]
KLQRHAMVPFIGIEAANVATNWFFGVRIVESQARASGTSSTTALQFEIGECTAAGSAATTASAARILEAPASAAGAAALSATVIRWSQVAAGTAAAWGQGFATAIRQPLAGGTLAGRAITTSAAGIRIVLLTAETLAGTSTVRVDIWVYADGTAVGEAAAALATPTGTWRAAATGWGVATLAGAPTRVQMALGAAAGVSTAALDPTIHIEGAAAGDGTATGLPIRMARGFATSTGHATQSVTGQRIQCGRAPASGAVLIGATGSWVKTVHGYAEGQGEAVAGSPDWRQTASAFSGCGSVLWTTEEFAGLIMTIAAEAAGSCMQVLAIPDAIVVLVEAEEPAYADGLADATAAPDLIMWPAPLTCDNQSLVEAVPETVLDAQIVMIEMSGWLAGDAQFSIAQADASSSGWSLALAASEPIVRMAEAQADGAAEVEYQEPPFVMEPVFLECFADVVASACSSEWVDGRLWAWSGSEALVAACCQHAEGVARGNAVVVGLGGFAIASATRRTRANSAIWARADTMAN